MAEFLGSVQGNRGKVSRCGSRKSGLHIVAASRYGAVRVDLSYHAGGRVIAGVHLISWHGRGVSRRLYYGPVSGEALSVAE